MAAIEEDFLKFLSQKTNLPAFYQHLNSNPGDKFAWFIRNGDDELDTLDDEVGAEPDIVYFDVEVYASTAQEISNKAKLMRSGRGYRGNFNSGAYVDDVSITDQRDDYEPQASAETLPPFMAGFRVAVSGYQPSST